MTTRKRVLDSTRFIIQHRKLINVKSRAYESKTCDIVQTFSYLIMHRFVLRMWTLNMNSAVSGERGGKFM